MFAIKVADMYATARIRGYFLDGTGQRRNEKQAVIDQHNKSLLKLLLQWCCIEVTRSQQRRYKTIK